MATSVDVGHAPFFCSYASLSPHFIERDPLATQLLALRKETLAGVPFRDQRLVFFAEFIP